MTLAITIGALIEQLTGSADHMHSTVDTLKFGNPNTQVKGIVTAFTATQHVIEQAITLGANLIITHEGTFFSHHEQTDSLQHDPVYIQKLTLIEQSGIAIYRFHDYWHRTNPDGIMTGLIRALNWQMYVDEQLPISAILTIPAMTVAEVAAYTKSQLGISYLRCSGNSSLRCRRVGLLVGYRGGAEHAIPLFEKHNVDLIIAGEGPEWETPEYVRDAVHQGREKALIMLGHAESEEPGMNYLAELLSDKYPMLPVHFLAEKPIFQII